MIGKFATVSALLLLIITIPLGGRGFAQTTPSGQTPATPDSTAQQPAVSKLQPRTAASGAAALQ